MWNRGRPPLGVSALSRETLSAFMFESWGGGDTSPSQNNSSCATLDQIVKKLVEMFCTFENIVKTLVPQIKNTWSWNIETWNDLAKISSKCLPKVLILWNMLQALQAKTPTLSCRSHEEGEAHHRIRIYPLYSHPGAALSGSWLTCFLPLKTFRKP